MVHTKTDEELRYYLSEVWQDTPSGEVAAGILEELGPEAIVKYVTRRLHEAKGNLREFMRSGEQDGVDFQRREIQMLQRLLHKYTAKLPRRK